MNKAYSNKALPSGTVLREWRLEEVLGVGGFGIVYKGRGIYFNELVAIKEYFPSSISERDAEDTVVPIDSDAEEVHALGLKKFVEEAKLLWNLSTPSRHPNIVNVRSLFEIHGTAYMVMDFEDGVSLSKQLKQGTRFNERSLLDLVRPIAEGLERAHRVGVLHRDIKPPNILINEDGKPVLIDFGSARFEAAEATSTKVTFHTPPYAAIEQYVKTYPQGPWTDIYALGVVLYECVTGEKPPEVLERMHAGLGTPLAEGKWPGYSKKFLAAIDAAMTIKPSERPQSISDWLAMFDGSGKAPRSKAVAVEVDDEATRFVSYDTPADEIVPVAPPAPGFDQSEQLETGVPADPADAHFKRAGQDTNASKKAATAAAVAAAASAAAAAAGDDKPAPEIGDRGAEAKKQDKAAPPKKDDAKAEPGAAKRKLSPVMAGGAAVAVLAAIGAGWALTGGSDQDALTDANIVANATDGVQTVAPTDVEALAPAAKTLADEARGAGAPAAAVDGLNTAAEELATMIQALASSAADPAAAEQRATEIRQRAMAANTAFAAALLRDAEGRAQRLAAAAPWASPARASASRNEAPDRQRAASTLRSTLAGLRSASQTTSAAADPAVSLASARDALVQARAFSSALTTAYSLNSTQPPRESARTATPAAPTAPAASAPARASKGSKAGEPASSSASSGGVSKAKLSQFNGIVSDGRNMARQVIRMAERDRPGANASAADKQAYELRRSNAALARNYDQYLATLKDSMRGVNSDREADRLIKDATQTRAYLTFLVKRSSDSLK